MARLLRIVSTSDVTVNGVTYNANALLEASEFAAEGDLVANAVTAGFTSPQVVESVVTTAEMLATIVAESVGDVAPRDYVGLLRDIRAFATHYVPGSLITAAILRLAQAGVPAAVDTVLLQETTAAVDTTDVIVGLTVNTNPSLTSYERARAFAQTRGLVDLFKAADYAATETQWFKPPLRGAVYPDAFPRRRRRDLGTTSFDVSF